MAKGSIGIHHGFGGACHRGPLRAKGEKKWPNEIWGHAAPKTGLPRMAVAMAVAVALATLVALLWGALAAEAASSKATTKTFSNGNQIRIPADRISGGTGGKADPYPSPST